MKDFVVKILTVLFIVSFIIAIPVSIVKSHAEKAIKNMTLDATYICEDDHDIKIKFTETFGNTPEGYLDTEDSRIAYLYVDDKEYYGLYKFGLADKFNKVINTTFYEGDFEQGRGICLEFDYNKKKLTILSILRFRYGFGDEGAFEKNQIFMKKTWWNTWGKKLIIILAVLFAIWLFKDVPKMLKDKEMMQEIKGDLKNNLKKGMNDIVEDLKNPYNNKNNTNGS